jgi:outer membrane protein
MDSFVSFFCRASRRAAVLGALFLGWGACASVQAQSTLPVSQGSSQQGSSQAVAGSGVRTFTLEECLKIAGTENLDVQNDMARLNDAQARVRTAWGQYLPSANISLGYSRTLNSTTGFNAGGSILEVPVSRPDIFFTQANVNYTLFDGLNRENTYAQSQANVLSAEKTAEQTRRRALNTIRSQYIAVLRAKQTLRIRREDFEVGKKQLERIKAQFEAGTVAVAPVYTQEADVANRELAIVQAENDLEIAKGILLASLGLNPTMSADFTDITIPQVITESDIKSFRSSFGETNQIASQAMQKRVDYASAQASIEAAQAAIRAAQGAWYPSVGAGFQYSWNGNDLTTFNRFSQQGLGVTMTYTLFDRFNREVTIQRAQISEDQAKIQKRITEQRISSDVQNAFTQLNAAEKSLDITARSLKSAEQNFNAAEERFKVGAANILDYTTANGTLVTARINRLNALYNYVAAQYQVRFAIGTLDNE